MKRLYSNVGSTKAALQQRPEVLNSVGVNIALYIALKMVHNQVSVVARQPLIVHELIGHDPSSRHDAIFDDLVHLFLLAFMAENGSLNFAIAFKHTHDSSLAVTALHSAISTQALTLRSVHVPSF